jgi:N-acyl amino acid synthase of PEP-CTERM/exosortase system
MSSLANHFSNYFSLSFAYNINLKQKVFKIRYKVYCEELGYEPTDRFPDGMETDIYDDRSLHFLLLHKPTQTYIGCVRMVLSDPQSNKSGFPFENICRSVSIDFQKTARANFCEISRLAVIDRFRKRVRDTKTADDTNNQDNLILQEDDRRQYQNTPLIPISLYLACTSIVERYNIDSFTLMEPRLARHLRRYGFPSHQICDFVEFHGKRGAFLIYTEEILKSFPPEVRELFLLIKEQLTPYRNLIEERMLSRNSMLV